MLLRLIYLCIALCIIGQVNSSPTFGTYQNNVSSNAQTSILGNILRAKARFWDEVRSAITQKTHIGVGAFSNNVNTFKESLNASISATGGLIDAGIAAGKHYGRTVFKGAIIVPKTIHDLVTACIHNNGYIDTRVAQNLSYVEDQPKYLFQFVDEIGQIVPITAEVAAQLVPGLSV